jgi:catechol 2,3-dioxygenase-like lactoylglutathione lyase family enzyme
VRRFDHAVIVVADLDHARQKFAALGFTLTPKARHPFGTENSLVQFAGRTFIELLAIADPAAFPPDAPDQFNFAAFNRDFLQRNGEGMSMLAVASADARADVAAFRAAGLQTYAPFDFGRDAVLPDGSVARVAFSLAFVTSPEMPDAAFFTCQQRHAPELFWKAAYQTHPNGIENLSEIVMTTADPDADARFFERLIGAPAEASVFGPPGSRLVLRRAPGARAPRFATLRFTGGAGVAATVCGVALEPAT